MELLAPAGGKEQLEYAIRFGADAVYLACERFGMRRRASNFTTADLPWVCGYAHARGVAVHLTCNTVMHEADLAELPAYFEAARAAGVDALIVSDMGAFALARRHAPGVALHVSTQASVCNSAAALAWHELGAKRVVCAREMSLADIAAMHAELPESLELEVFAHGSMCMAYSGRCIISDHLNGRAANGGHCTQPCRWEWRLAEPSRPGEEFTVEEDGRATYLFSSRDLNMLEHLDELAAAGVDSVKLEGRGRGAFYAATVTGAYRRVLDGEDPALVAGELDTVSHHPYGTGFFFGPAHQAPYLRQSQSEWMWVAEVLDCEEVEKVAGEGAFRWQASVRARNRFDCASELEVLSPGRASEPVHVADLRWAPEDAGSGEPASEPISVDAVTRQMERYLMLCDRPLRPCDIVRARRKPSEMPPE